MSAAGVPGTQCHTEGSPPVIVDVFTPRGAPAQLSVRDGTSDLAVAGSTYRGVAGGGLVDEYGLADFHTNGRFVDVGAHIGSVGIAVLLDNPQATAVFVEPIPENLEVLRDNLARNGLEDRATVLDGAVGTGTITYNFGGGEFADTNRYIGNLNVPATRHSGITLNVRRRTLAELLPCEAMKLDCEGGEWALFADPLIASVPYVFGEYHGVPGAEGVLEAFRGSHHVEFTSIGQAAGNFRAVAR